jgi:chromosome segregation ATPase
MSTTDLKAREAELRYITTTLGDEAVAIEGRITSIKLDLGEMLKRLREVEGFLADNASESLATQAESLRLGTTSLYRQIEALEGELRGVKAELEAAASELASIETYLREEAS